MESNMSLYIEHKRVLENNKEVSSPASLLVSLTGENNYSSGSLQRLGFSACGQDSGCVQLAVSDVQSPSRLIHQENHIEGQYIKKNDICSVKNDSTRSLEKDFSAEKKTRSVKGSLA